MHFVPFDTLLLEQSDPKSTKNDQQPKSAYHAMGSYRKDDSGTPDVSKLSAYHASGAFNQLPSKAKEPGKLSTVSTFKAVTKFLVKDQIEFFKSLAKDVKTDINSVRNQFQMTKSGYPNIFVDQYNLRKDDPNLLSNPYSAEFIGDWLTIFTHHDIFGKPSVAKNAQISFLTRPNDLKLSKKLKTIFNRHKNMKAPDAGISIAKKINFGGKGKNLPNIPLSTRLKRLYDDLENSNFPVIQEGQRDILIKIIEKEPDIQYIEFCHYFLRPIYKLNAKNKSGIFSPVRGLGLENWNDDLESFRVRVAENYSDLISFLMNAAYLDPYADFTVKELKDSEEKWRKQKGSKWQTYVPYELGKYHVMDRGLRKLLLKAQKISTVAAAETAKARATRGATILILAYFLIDPIGEATLLSLKSDLDKIISILEKALEKAKEKPGSYDSKVVDELHSIFEEIQRKLLFKLREKMTKVDDDFEQDPEQEKSLLQNTPRYEVYQTKVSALAKLVTEFSIPKRGTKLNEKEINDILERQKEVKKEVIEAYGQFSLVRGLGSLIKWVGDSLMKNMQKGIEMGMDTKITKENKQIIDYSINDLTLLVREQIAAPTTPVSSLTSIWETITGTKGKPEYRPKFRSMKAAERKLQSISPPKSKNKQGKIEFELSPRSSEDQGITDMIFNQFFSKNANQAGKFEYNNDKQIKSIRSLSFASDLSSGIQNRSLFGLQTGNDSYQIAVFPTHKITNEQQMGPSVLYYRYSLDPGAAKLSVSVNKEFPPAIIKNYLLLSKIIKHTKNMLSTDDFKKASGEELVNVQFIKNNLEVIKQIYDVFRIHVSLDNVCTRELAKIDTIKIYQFSMYMNDNNILKTLESTFNTNKDIVNQEIKDYKKWASLKVKAWEGICKVDEILRDNNYYVFLPDELHEALDKVKAAKTSSKAAKPPSTAKKNKQPKGVVKILHVIADGVDRPMRRELARSWVTTTAGKKKVPIEDMPNYVAYKARLKKYIKVDLARRNPIMLRKKQANRFGLSNPKGPDHPAIPITLERGPGNVGSVDRKFFEDVATGIMSLINEEYHQYSYRRSQEDNLRSLKEEPKTISNLKHMLGQYKPVIPYDERDKPGYSINLYKSIVSWQKFLKFENPDGIYGSKTHSRFKKYLVDNKEAGFRTPEKQIEVSKQENK